MQVRTFKVEQLSGRELPGSEYVVLDVAHDYSARVNARHHASMLRSYGRTTEAGMIMEALERSEPTFIAHVEAADKARKSQKKKSKKRSRSGA